MTSMKTEKGIIHLTLTGVHAGFPLCGCERGKQPSNTRFWHAVYAPIEKFRNEVCPECLRMWDSTTEKKAKVKKKQTWYIFDPVRGFLDGMDGNFLEWVRPEDYKSITTLNAWKFFSIIEAQTKVIIVKRNRHISARIVTRSEAAQIIRKANANVSSIS